VFEAGTSFPRFSENFDLPEDEKYDRPIEIWEGHNVADFVDTNIMEVSCD
jgi:hypothetical protein